MVQGDARPRPTTGAGNGAAGRRTALPDTPRARPGPFQQNCCHRGARIDFKLSRWSHAPDFPLFLCTIIFLLRKPLPDPIRRRARGEIK